MPDIKISQLSGVSEVQSSDIVPVVSGAATMSATAAQLKTYVTKDLDVADSAVAGSYVTAVSEADGSITVTREAADGTPTSASTKMVTSGGVYTETNNIKTSIAPVEDGNTVAKSGGYAVGEQFYRGGVLYEVTTAIAAGLSWSNVSANYTAASNITSQISNLKIKITDDNSRSQFVVCLIEGDASVSHIKNGASLFSKYRNPILCWYTNQNNTPFACIITTGQSAETYNFSCTPIIGDAPTSVSIDTDNNIVLNGWGANWGFGLAIGLR